MLQMLISAQNSGSGKTTVTIALLAALAASIPVRLNPGPIILIPCFTAAYSALKVTILICFSQSCK